MLLGVNIDHVATVREARKGLEPDIMTAAVLAQLGGADGITVHLRQDRRHINEADVVALKAGIKVPLNVEISLSAEILNFILKVKPDKVCIVPENKNEITTEGGLNLANKSVCQETQKAVKKLQKSGIEVALFIEPDHKMIDLAKKLDADAVELNTSSYADAENLDEIDREFSRLKDASEYACVDKKLIVNMGHGLDYDNVFMIATLDCVTELNIGHAIIAKSVFSGIETAVSMMMDAIDEY